MGKISYQPKAAAPRKRKRTIEDFSFTDDYRPRGRPASGKKQITILLDPDVIAKFRATGDGWQARINAVLKEARL